ncbi:hypothetical protein GCM10027068_21930 [Prescottella soli]
MELVPVPSAADCASAGSDECKDHADYDQNDSDGPDYRDSCQKSDDQQDQSQDDHDRTSLRVRGKRAPTLEPCRALNHPGDIPAGGGCETYEPLRVVRFRGCGTNGCAPVQLRSSARAVAGFRSGTSADYVVRTISVNPVVAGPPLRVT